MSRIIDLTGQRFGRLVVIKRVGGNKHGRSMWLCKCDCGTEKIITGNYLINGDTKSCGCLKLETAIKNGKANKTHDYSNTSIYNIWRGILARCNNTKNKAYKNYGKRKIKVCYRWSNKNPKGFQNFLDDMGEPPSTQHQIDRINNNLGYYKENCHWVTPKENCRNKRNNILITYNNKMQCLKSWAEELKISYQTLWARIYKYNWSIEKAFTTPSRVWNRR